MALTVTVSRAQEKLRELIANLSPGEEVVITENDQPIAKLVGEPRQERPSTETSDMVITRNGEPVARMNGDVSGRSPRPAPGLGKGSILYIAPDFDETPDDFKEYLE